MITTPNKKLEDRVYKMLTSYYTNEIIKPRRKIFIRPNGCEQTHIYFTSEKYAKARKDTQQGVYAVCIMPKANIIRSKKRAFLAKEIIKEKKYLEGFDCIIRDTGFDDEIITNIDNFIVAANIANKNNLTLL